MTLAMGPIWKMPNTQEHPKMKSWAKALNVSNLGEKSCRERVRYWEVAVVLVGHAPTSGLRLPL